eukprot:1193529-Amorphochlora_amoeboformis.AAC.1
MDVGRERERSIERDRNIEREEKTNEGRFGGLERERESKGEEKVIVEREEGEYQALCLQRTRLEMML